MTAIKILTLAAMPLFAVMQGGQPHGSKQTARKSTPPPAFKEIIPSALGDKWYASYLFDIKNISALNEKSEQSTRDGAPVYIFTDTHQTDFGGKKSLTRTVAVCATDFSLLNLDSRESGENDTAAVCQSVRPGAVECTFTGDGADPEKKLFESPGGGPVFYDGAIDRLELAMDWTPGTSLDIDYLDLEKKKLSRMVITLKPPAPGQPPGAVRLQHIIPDDDMQLEVTAAAGKLISYIWKKDDMEVFGYPVAGEKQAKAEKYKFASQVSPEKRTPVQAVLVMLTAMGAHDTAALMQSFDLEKMYAALKQEYPEAEGMPFDDWKKIFTETMLRPNDDLMPEDGEPEEMAKILEAMGPRAFDVTQDGDGATVIFKPGGVASITVRLYRAADGRWLVYWVDAAEQEK